MKLVKWQQKQKPHEYTHSIWYVSPYYVALALRTPVTLNKYYTCEDRTTEQADLTP